MSEAVLISRIKEMKCGSKTIPQEYIDCFNDYIEKVINTRVDEEIAVNFEAGKFKTAKDLVYAYKNLEKVFTKSRQKIADLEAKLAESEKKFVTANNLRKNSDEVLLNYKTEKYGLDKTIQELRKMKLSLPEKEWYYKGFENCEKQISSHIADLTLEIKELKQQLAEKDAEVQSWKDGTMVVKLGKLEEQLAEKEKEETKRMEEFEKACQEYYSSDKYKKDFAIAELKKLKEEFNGAFSISIQQEMFDKYIDQQIKSLKGEE